LWGPRRRIRKANKSKKYKMSKVQKESSEKPLYAPLMTQISKND
jgi:hypothetical protein